MFTQGGISPSCAWYFVILNKSCWECLQFCRCVWNQSVGHINMLTWWKVRESPNLWPHFITVHPVISVSVLQQWTGGSSLSFTLPHVIFHQPDVSQWLRVKTSICFLHPRSSAAQLFYILLYNVIFPILTLFLPSSTEPDPKYPKSWICSLHLCAAHS